LTQEVEVNSYLEVGVVEKIIDYTWLDPYPLAQPPVKLLRISRIIREEAQDMFYGENMIFINPRASQDLRWLRAMSKASGAAIRNAQFFSRFKHNDRIHHLLTTENSGLGSAKSRTDAMISWQHVARSTLLGHWIPTTKHGDSGREMARKARAAAAFAATRSRARRWRIR